jgi:four helix bundle protein
MKNNLNELKVWQKSIELAQAVYISTKGFPSTEKYGLTSQIRRSAVSVASNIAEGAGRNTNKEFNHFLGIAKGSGYELMTQVILSNKMNLITNETKEKLVAQVDEVHRMIHGLQQKFN